ncbi:NAD(P)/FAD-dependent oxidoreductase [Crocosphaera chwakensis]|uniref:FAD dependent oxidoreductase n=1 Tax=Crocosphaera chwakensis CCY0110 TaxID=391612 RepID=A3IM42_9CHRO|nr:FAD-binding oxidoreductase [Crocosphaera chwakensis]EAZ92498.1 FAD dependent oxidoreductase [Crocosphaera chwakensis CCY0110]
MKNFDWIVVGAGITGATLSYELAKQGLAVLLLEKDSNYTNATRYSYGGIAYWSGTDNFSTQLCKESREMYHQLSEELGQNTEFRELDLMLTIPIDKDPKTITKNYQKFFIKPQLLSPQESTEIEPLLNPDTISGCLKLPHGHIHPQKTNNAYQQAFLRLDGTIKYEEVTQLLSENETLTGVQTNKENYHSKNVVVCAGGLSRSLLKTLGITLNIYFTHSQLILTSPVDTNLRTLVMPAILNRLDIEEKSGNSELKSLWNRPNDEIISNVMEPGAIQFLDGRFCLGQISQIRTNPYTKLDSKSAEKTIRQGVGKVLPELQELPGKLHHCLVAFCPDSNFLVGKIDTLTGLHVFSGFTSTFVFAPALAKRFANWVIEDDKKMPSLL